MSINEYEIFKLADYDEVVKIDYRTIGDTEIPLVVVDNFYENPDMVRDLALSLPYTTSQYVCNHSPGERVRMSLDIRVIRNITYHLLKLPEWKLKPTTLQVIFNKMRGDAKLEAIQTNPHIDGVDMLNAAMVLYLNKPEECVGGTAFYRHKKTGFEILNTQDQFTSTFNNDRGKLTRNDYTDFVTESNEEWELIDMIEMKYNRMVIYPPNVFHSAYLTRNDFLEYDRLTQLGFF